MTIPAPLRFNRDFYLAHANLLCNSYEHCLRQPLIQGQSTPAQRLELLFAAPFVLLSHGTQADPIFNFGNQTALKLFELTWEQLMTLPSRQSAEPVNRAERQRLLDCVTKQGYIDDYSGVRISSTGRRFLIEKAIVWNLVDEQGKYHGQAATFDHWTFLEAVNV